MTNEIFPHLKWRVPKYCIYFVSTEIINSSSLLAQFTPMNVVCIIASIKQNFHFVTSSNVRIISIHAWVPFIARYNRVKKSNKVISSPFFGTRFALNLRTNDWGLDDPCRLTVSQTESGVNLFTPNFCRYTCQQALLKFLQRCSNYSF